MAVPILTGISKAAGPSGGKDLVRLTGSGFAEQVSVIFGDAQAKVLSVREEAGASVADVRTPSHQPATVDVVLINLDQDGDPVPGEEATLAGAYRFVRSRLARDSDLTRLVRTLLQELKRQIVENTSITVSVDYDDTTIDGLNVVALSRLPSLVLSGPRMDEDRFFSTNELREEIVAGPGGPEVLRCRPPYTVDLSFTLTAASDRTVELLNLMAAVATFFNRNRWIEMPREPRDQDGETVRWEMDPEGEFRTRLDEGDDVRVFTCGFVVRGFDIDEGRPLDIGREVEEPELDTSAIQPGDET